MVLTICESGLSEQLLKQRGEAGHSPGEWGVGWGRGPGPPSPACTRPVCRDWGGGQGIGLGTRKGGTHVAKSQPSSHGIGVSAMGPLAELRHPLTGGPAAKDYLCDDLDFFIVQMGFPPFLLFLTGLFRGCGGETGWKMHRKSRFCICVGGGNLGKSSERSEHSLQASPLWRRGTVTSG